MTLQNLLIGLPMMLLCLLVQVSVAFWSVRYYMRRVTRNPPGGSLYAGIRPLLMVTLIMMLGNFVQITLWGALFVVLGEFGELYEAIYHSGVNFTSLGYGDVVMSRSWKLLGPLEALNGVLMLGMTAAAMMAILQQMVRTLQQTRGGE